MDVKIGLAAVGLGVMALASPASSQTTPILPGSHQTIPEKDVNSTGRLKEQQAPSSIQNGRSDSLSKKLSETGGVIQPQGEIDPGMKAHAPVEHPNSMPVIPPSATGGDSAK